MSLLEFLIYLCITSILVGATASSSAIIIHHAQHLANVSRLAQKIQGEYTASSWQSESRILPPLQTVKSTPKVIRFNQGESVTPSSLLLDDTSLRTQLTLSIRGNLSLKSTTSFGE
jgi:hypothetical protein